MKRKLIWCRGYNAINQLGDYSIKECRIGAMLYELGWKAALRNRRESRATGLQQTKHGAKPKS